MATKKELALELLSYNLPQVDVAAALGVTPAAISQLLVDESFRRELSELKVKNLTAASARDKKLDGLEDSLITKLEDSVKLLVDPMKVTKVFQTVNGAKRRGVAASPTSVGSETVVSLQIPRALVDKLGIKISVDGQVVSVEGQDLRTMQTHVLDGLIHEGQDIQPKELNYDQKSEQSSNPASTHSERNISGSKNFGSY
jgi:hypothetical protein